MSQLQTNLTNLQTILDSINNLPEATTLPTCTVNITSGDATITQVACTAVDTATGAISPLWLNMSMDSVTIENVLCNSIISLLATDVSSLTANDNCELLFAVGSSDTSVNFTGKITAPNGEAANIVLT